MTTMQEDKIQTTSEGESLAFIEVEGGQLLTLLEGVSTHAGKDKSLPVLNAVEAESEDQAIKQARETFGEDTGSWEMAKYAEYEIEGEVA